MGYPVNISNSKTLNDSIVAYLGRPHISDEEKAAVTVMIQLMSRSMVVSSAFTILFYCLSKLYDLNL